MTYPLPGVFVDGSVTVPVSATNLNDYTTAITGLDTRAPIRGSFTNPNGNVTGSPGNTYSSTAGGIGTTFWIKESGTGTTSGWVAVSSGGGGGVPTSRLITSGTGLSGGGDLTTDRTLIVVGDTTIQRVEVAKNGTQVGANARKRINLIEGANVTITAADNSGGNQMDVTIAAATSGSAGIPASTITTKGDLIVANASGAATRLPANTDGYILKCIAATGNGLGVLWTPPIYDTIQNPAGSALTQRRTLKFLGSGVTVADNNSTLVTEVTITGGSGIPTSLIVNPGDLIVGNASSAPSTLNSSVVTDGSVLTARPAGGGQGVDWEALPSFYSTIQDEGFAIPKQPALNFIGPAVAAVNNNGSLRTDVTIADPSPIPQDHGLSGWTFDPVAASSTNTSTNGLVYIAKIKVPFTINITQIWWYLSAIAVTPTASSNEVGIYNSTGTKQASVNVDTSSSTGSANHVVTSTITSTQVNPPFIWVGFVFNAATPPILGRAASGLTLLTNVNLATAAMRFATVIAGQSVLPSSLTLSGNAVGPALWAAIA